MAGAEEAFVRNGGLKVPNLGHFSGVGHPQSVRKGRSSFDRDPSAVSGTLGHEHPIESESALLSAVRQFRPALLLVPHELLQCKSWGQTSQNRKNCAITSQSPPVGKVTCSESAPAGPRGLVPASTAHRLRVHKPRRGDDAASAGCFAKDRLRGRGWRRTNTMPGTGQRPASSRVVPIVGARWFGASNGSRNRLPDLFLDRIGDHTGFVILPAFA